MTDVRLEGLSKRFGELTACSDIDLEIESGEFFVLLGPSGCGKTTTLRMIAGLEMPSEGSIFFDDEPVTDRKPAERDIAFVFQNYALYPHKTVAENIGFPLRLSRSDASKEERRGRVEEVARQLQIEDQLEKRPKNLSGGQQQRVALGRSIIREPEVFLMDEPLSNLDAKLRIEMRSELKQLHEEFDITTVYVTHDQIEAMSLADRICVLRDGSVQQVGPPREVFEWPQNTWVAGFMGSPPMNFLPGTYRGDEERAVVGDAYEYPLGAHDDLDLEDGTPVQLGIRPKDVSVREESARDTIPATILTVEPTGERSILTVQVGDHTLKIEIDDNTAFDDAQGRDVHLEPTKTYVYGPDEQLRSRAVTSPEVAEV
ncbi:MAG: ABC transporter ATP-binding protein [Halobacteriales archaeon]